MKIIVVQWVPEDSMYSKAMRVIVSDHPRFTVGTRFDFGFMSIATDEGYVIVSNPMPPSENKVVANSSHNISRDAMSRSMEAPTRSDDTRHPY